MLLQVSFVLAVSAAIEGWKQLLNPDVVHGDGQRSLSEVNILLPVHKCKDCRRAYHMVAAYNGCYQWKLSRDQLIDLKEYRSESHPECANVVELSAASPNVYRQPVWLTARDLRTQQVLRAEVRVAEVASIAVAQRFDHIGVGDPHKLEVKAYDQAGNSFSTVEGFMFDWITLSGHDSIVRVKPHELGISKQLASEHPGAPQEGSKNDDDFYCKGIKAGAVSLQVKLLEPGYEAVPTTFANFSVVRPFEVLPEPSQLGAFETDSNLPEIFILPTSDFKLKLAHVTMGEDESTTYDDIALPSARHDWSLDASSAKLGSIAQDGFFSGFNKPGRVDIRVVERGLESNSAAGTIVIVEPFSLRLELCEVSESHAKTKLENPRDRVASFARQLNATKCQRNWIMVEGKTYLLRVKVLDKEYNRILLTKNLQFSHDFDKSMITLLASNSIGSEMVVQVHAHSHDGEVAPAHRTILSSTLKEIHTT